MEVNEKGLDLLFRIIGPIAGLIELSDDITTKDKVMRLMMPLLIVKSLRENGMTNSDEINLQAIHVMNEMGYKLNPIPLYMRGK